MSDPNGFAAGVETPITLGEVQHVPELFLVTAAVLDSTRNRRCTLSRGCNTCAGSGKEQQGFALL